MVGPQTAGLMNKYDALMEGSGTGLGGPDDRKDRRWKSKAVVKAKVEAAVLNRFDGCSSESIIHWIGC